jgi:SSS family solute:Na+ symporter/sodium/proline symporter
VTLAWGELSFIKESLPDYLSDLDAVLPAITVSVLALVVISLLTPAPKAPPEV